MFADDAYGGGGIKQVLNVKEVLASIIEKICLIKMKTLRR